MDSSSSDDERMHFGGVFTDEQRTSFLERIKRRRDREIARDEKMKIDWMLMTGQSMDSRDLSRMKRDFIEINGAYLGPKDFERMKNNWLMLTGGSMSPSDFEKIKRDYLLLNWTNMTSSTFQQLKRNWLLFTGTFDPGDLEKLKRDYLVLNWTKMSTRDYEKFKTNWLTLTERIGMDNQEDIIKRWLVQHVPYLEYRYMSDSEKVEYTRLCLERGADVNALNRGGYTLLHMVVTEKCLPLIELLVSYGADVTIRNRDGKTPLDSIRIYSYRGHDEIVQLLQTAEKSIRTNALMEHESQSSSSEAILIADVHVNTQLGCNSRRGTLRSDRQQDEIKLPCQCDPNKAQEWWIQTTESFYLNQASKLFERGELADIDNFFVTVINYMFVSKTLRQYFKLNQSASRHDNIIKMHQFYSTMCTKLFNIFDPIFNKSISITFPPTAKICENAELLFSIDIHPEMEWVALKVFADPSDIEYSILCAAGSQIRFMLSRNHLNHFSFCSENLMCRYENVLGPHQQQLRRLFFHQ